MYTNQTKIELYHHLKLAEICSENWMEKNMWLLTFREERGNCEAEGDQRHNIKQQKDEGDGWMRIVDDGSFRRLYVKENRHN